MTVMIFSTLAFTALFGTAPTHADEPKLPDVSTFDKQVIDVLRTVHNQGAELYNQKADYAGAYRLYQGSLLTIRPLLAHRPEAQKIIDTALEAVATETNLARKAFLLHECIEGVRKHLKTVNRFPAVVAPVPPPGSKPGSGSKDQPPTGTSVNGSVRIKGTPLAEGEVTFVSLDQPEPKVVSTTVTRGTYQLTQAVPPGKYAVIVTGKGVPEPYTVVTTSNLRVIIVTGRNSLDFDLK